MTKAAYQPLESYWLLDETETDADEWRRAWAGLFAQTGDYVEYHKGEQWQYMGSERRPNLAGELGQWYHVFRHRNRSPQRAAHTAYAASGRCYLRILASDDWTPDVERVRTTTVRAN